MGKWNYFHSMDPFIIAFTENFGLRWYSMAYIIGFFIVYILLLRVIKNKQSPLDKESLVDLIFYCALGMIAGGRLGYALFYTPSLFVEWDLSFPYWGLLKIHEGGLASHGGIAGLIGAILLFKWRRGGSAFHYLDLAVLGGAQGVFFGRVANFINGELFGRVVSEKAWLTVQFPQEMFNWVSEKNIQALRQLREALSHLPHFSGTGKWFGWLYEFESTNQYRSQIYSAIHSLIKEVEGGNQEVILSLQRVISYRHPSQLYQAVLEGLFPFLIIWLVWKKSTWFIRWFPFLKVDSFNGIKWPLKPGWVAGLWVLCYSIARLTGEQFRMPDAHIGFGAMGLTRGQWLTLFMLLGLLVYFVFVFRDRSKN